MRRVVTALREMVKRLTRPSRRAWVPVPVRGRSARGGFTLVEMLVTVAITLILMGAVVRLFASVGQGMETRRATIEITNELRIARMLLAQDLANATALTLPPRDPKSAEGYLEIVEGIHTDWFPTRLTNGTNAPAVGDFELDASNPSTVPTARAANAQSPAEELLFQTDSLRRLGSSALGDFDDVLAFTVRSQGEPFVGRMVVYDVNNNPQRITIKSHEAEVIWYAVENPAVPRSHHLYLGEPGMRTIYRRVLLIAPWTSASLDQMSANSNLRGQFPRYLFDPSQPATYDTFRAFFRQYDISVRVERADPTDPGTARWVPNSLADLTKRENRFAHSDAFPHAMDVRRVRFTDPFLVDTNSNANAMLRSASPLVPFGSSIESLSNVNDADPSTRLGEDVVATNVLAFDLRVFDPKAPIKGLVGNGSAAADTAVEPSDIGWRRDDLATIGHGAYVDLAYVANPQGLVNNPVNADNFATQDALQSLSAFAVAPHLKSGLVPVTPQLVNANLPFLRPEMLVRGVYDTWSYHYEYDGVNQDQDGVDLDDDGTLDIPLIDEGTDGLDLDSDVVNNRAVPHLHGVDDMSERETSPPYPVALRGMEVRMRIYESDTRQIREVSVKQNFTPQ